MVLHESGEDYLEAILVLRQQKGHVRSIDVAQHLGFSKPSVSRAVSILKANGYLTMEKDGRLELTPQGEYEAQRVYERHRFLSEWLVMLGVSPEVAAADACRLEYYHAVGYAVIRDEDTLQLAVDSPVIVYNIRH